MAKIARFAFGSLWLACFAWACTDARPEADPPPAESVASPQDAWWEQLTALCGQAFEGRLTSTDAADADLADQPMVMHVRRCMPNRVEVPFHIGENRSRTWVLTRSPVGIGLHHDHRHEDGTSDVVTMYGGTTLDPGTSTVQRFPVDQGSKDLFDAEGLSASTVNVWSLEIVAGELFRYGLDRPQRRFRAEFDLRRPVDPPPAPWGASD